MLLNWTTTKKGVTEFGRFKDATVFMSFITGRNIRKGQILNRTFQNVKNNCHVMKVKLNV